MTLRERIEDGVRRNLQSSGHWPETEGQQRYMLTRVIWAVESALAETGHEDIARDLGWVPLEEAGDWWLALIDEAD